MCVDGGAEELKDRAALGFAGTDGGPDPFAPALALVSASAPGDASIDDEVTDGLFRHVVGGFDAGGGEEGEELLGMEAKALTQIAYARSGGERSGSV